MSDSAVIRQALGSETDDCVDLWVRACAARDGRRVEGVGERAAAKFERSVLWLVAEDSGRLVGFALATEPASGAQTDPPDAAVLGLLAVSPHAQGDGLGRSLLRATVDGLATRGYRQAVLHVLADNLAAVRLYESEGWRRRGDRFAHPLLQRMSETYVTDL